MYVRVISLRPFSFLREKKLQENSQERERAKLRDFTLSPEQEIRLKPNRGGSSIFLAGYWWDMGGKVQNAQKLRSHQEAKQFFFFFLKIKPIGKK